MVDTEGLRKILYRSSVYYYYKIRLYLRKILKPLFNTYSWKEYCSRSFIGLTTYKLGQNLFPKIFYNTYCIHNCRWSE